MQSIADEVGAHQQTVKRALLRHRIERTITPPKRAEVRVTPSRRIEFDPDWLRRRHDIDRMSIPSIAAEAVVSSHTIRRALLRHGISTKHPNAAQPGGIDPEWLRKRYVEDGLSRLRRACVRQRCTGRWSSTASLGDHLVSATAR